MLGLAVQNLISAATGSETLVFFIRLRNVDEDISNWVSSLERSSAASKAFVLASLQTSRGVVQNFSA
jgi:K+-transporting ATPase A subunit